MFIMGYLNDSEKAELGAAFHEAMSSFFVPIVIYSAPERTIVSEDPTYNRFNGVDQNNLTPDNTPIRHVVSGRIQYGTQQPLEGEPYHKVYIPEGMVRVKIDNSGAALLYAAKEIELNGDLFNVDSSPRRHGIFSGTYTTIFLKKVQ